MRSIEEIKERSNTAHLMIAKFGADGEKTVCYQSMEDIPSLITTIESQQEEITETKRLLQNELSHAVVMAKENENLMQDMLDLKDKMFAQVESQKEEIEQLQRPALYLAYRVLRQKHEKDAELFVEHINGLEAQIESRKAITELAVKGLQFYADERNHKWTEKAELAKSTLSQIEVLQNEQT